MARSSSGFYSTIEYIGPRPQKPKKNSPFGGWVIGVIAIGVGFWFGRPLVSSVIAAQVGPTTEQAGHLIDSLEKNSDQGAALAAAALSHAGDTVTYDPAYIKIGYPNGDVPAHKGVAADVIIRCYRALGIDLQKEVHEDMAANFNDYPQLWNATAPDTNIDHRRVPNLQRYFIRKGEQIKPSRDASEYKPGDIVVWAVGKAEMHIGIVVPGPGTSSGEPWIIHNNGAGVKWENVLFDNQILGHYRFPVTKH